MLAYGGNDYKPPTSVQYSLGIQHQLSQAVTFGVQYAGDTTYHQNIQKHINTVPLNDPNRINICGAACGSTTPYNQTDQDRFFPGFGDIALLENTARGHYDSLRVALRATNLHRLTLSAAYTYSHGIDITSNDRWDSVSNPFNLQYDRGNSQLDRRHIAVFSYIYELPLLRNSSGMMKSLVGGWHLSGVSTFETGTPLNITYGLDNLGLGGGTTNRRRREDILSEDAGEMVQHFCTCGSCAIAVRYVGPQSNLRTWQG